MSVSRRTFFKSSMASSVLLAAPALLSAEKSTRYKTALIGSGWWGMNIARVALQSGQNEITAVCDVDGNLLTAAADELEKLTGEKPNVYRDYRQLLLTEKPRIVIVATPDHWHPLITIEAIRAGADVYVEKPVGHTIKEGRAMVRAARESGSVVQVGTHRRVSPHNISGIKFLKEGNAGQIAMIRAFVNSGGGGGRPTPDSSPPEGLDWDMWCGPAPLRPYNRRIHPRGFRNFLDYANGRLGDWGVHWMDHILWWTEEKYPRSISSTGGRFIVDDNTDAPDTQIVTFDFESFTATWEHRYYGGRGPEKHDIGCYFYGTKGIFHMGWRDGWTFYPAGRDEGIIHEDPQLHDRDAHNIPELWEDFLTCIKTRNRPVCDIEIGHLSTNMSLLGMMALKIGRTIKWDGEEEKVIDDPEAEKMLRREYRSPWVYPEAG